MILVIFDTQRSISTKMLSSLALFAFPIVARAASSITASYPIGFVGGSPTFSATFETITAGATVYAISCPEEGCGGAAQYTDLGSGNFIWEGFRTTSSVDQSTITNFGISYSVSCSPDTEDSKSVVCDQEYDTMSSVVGAGGSSQSVGDFAVSGEAQLLFTTVIEIVATSSPPPATATPTQSSGSMSNILSPPTLTSTKGSSAAQTSSSSITASTTAKGNAVVGRGAAGALAGAAVFICAIL
jgi:hypothetical protein